VLVGAASSYVSTLLSGGGSLLSVPALILLGLPPSVAIATERMGNIGTVLVSLYRFRRAKKIVTDRIVPFTVLSAAGAVMGPFLILNIDEDTVAWLIGVILILTLPLALLKRGFGLERRSVSGPMLAGGFVLYALGSVYNGSFGMAGGLLTVNLFILCFGLTYLEANALEKLTWLPSLLISTAIFAWCGLIDYGYALPLLLGMGVGG